MRMIGVTGLVEIPGVPFLSGKFFQIWAFVTEMTLTFRPVSRIWTLPGENSFILKFYKTVLFSVMNLYMLSTGSFRFKLVLCLLNSSSVFLLSFMARVHRDLNAGR